MPSSRRHVGDQDIGDSMSPILEDGYVVAIDTADRDPKKLLNAMVAARDPEGGVTIKWLRKVGDDVMLIAQHTSPRYNPIFLNREPGWAIIGKVLFWIGKPS
jgi:SOS-response transcriptional repressor LexA